MFAYKMYMKILSIFIQGIATSKLTGLLGHSVSIVIAIADIQLFIHSAKKASFFTLVNINLYVTMFHCLAIDTNLASMLHLCYMCTKQKKGKRPSSFMDMEDLKYRSLHFTEV